MPSQKKSKYKDLAEYYQPGKKKKPISKIFLEDFKVPKKKKAKKKAGAKKMAVKKFVRLECTDGASNKFYEVELIQDGTRYTTAASYGRIGNNPQHQVKYEGTSLALASNEFSDLIKEKLKKGYVKTKESSEETVQKSYIKPLSQATAAKQIAETTVAPKKTKVEKEDVEEDRFDNFDLD